MKKILLVSKEQVSLLNPCLILEDGEEEMATNVEMDLLCQPCQVLY
jgi:hypothetical protein